MGVTVRRGVDGVRRCAWCGDDPLYVAYHDEEWGRPLRDDHRLFEKLCLEGFQAGLSWLTILRKREDFRRAFHGFDPLRVARMGARDVRRLLQDASIVRHRGKIESAIHNASRALELIEEAGSLRAFLVPWVGSDAFSGVPATTPASTELARELKRRGWSFVGPTTVYAFMQSVGLVNDHVPGCSVRAQIEAERRRGWAPARRRR